MAVCQHSITAARWSNDVGFKYKYNKRQLKTKDNYIQKTAVDKREFKKKKKTEDSLQET